MGPSSDSERSLPVVVVGVTEVGLGTRSSSSSGWGRRIDQLLSNTLSLLDLVSDESSLSLRSTMTDPLLSEGVFGTELSSVGISNSDGLKLSEKKRGNNNENSPIFCHTPQHRKLSSSIVIVVAIIYLVIVLIIVIVVFKLEI